MIVTIGYAVGSVLSLFNFFALIGIYPLYLVIILLYIPSIWMQVSIAFYCVKLWQSMGGLDKAKEVAKNPAAAANSEAKATGDAAGEAGNNAV